MPRYRKLYTNTIDSLDVDAMPDDFHRLTWVLLPLILCRDGRGMYYPTWLRSKLYPLRSDVTDSMIADVFAWYEQRGMIAAYEVDGRRYFYVPTWSKFQGITTKESESPYPPPPEQGKTYSRPTQELVKTNSGQSLPLVNIASESEDESESKDESISDEPFRVLYDAFLEATNMHETMLNGAKAVDEITKRWIPGGVTPDEVRNAAKELLSKDYNISGPWSLTNSINMLKAKGSKKVDKPVAWEVFG
jgi:hypothetical protein